MVVNAGNRLRELRVRLGLSMRDVESYSRKLARVEGIPEYFVSRPRLEKIENTRSTPSIFKLYSLSVIYRQKLADMLRLYGIDLEKIPILQTTFPLPQTHLTAVEVYDDRRSIAFPIHFDAGFAVERTNLLSRVIETWGEVPIAFIQHLDLRKSLYGYIGVNDYTLSPLIKPGSFVQIDDRSTKVQAGPWKNELQRPIYFIELRDAYVCSWCELHGKQLFLIPHPLSGRIVRQFSYPAEAGIIGRVTGVAMRIVDEVDLVMEDSPSVLEHGLSLK